MIPDLIILFTAFILIIFIIGIIRESTALFIVGAGFSFIMCAMVRLIEIPYIFLDSGDVVVTGSYLFEDLTSVVIFFILGILNVILYFGYRVQHSAEELQNEG